MDFAHPTRRVNLVISLYLAVYLLAGLITERGLMVYKPLPESLLSDFSYYERALRAALAGQDPYGIRQIGPAFLYPPPALLAVEVLALAPPGLVRAAVFAIVNIGLLVIMVTGVARLFHYPLRSVWWWFPLALGFAPFYELLHVGQINVITEAGIFLIFWAELTSPAASGLGLSLAIVTKVTPAFFLGYLFINKRFKSMFWAAIGVAACTVVALLRYGWLPFQVYPDVFSGLLHTFPLDLHSQSLVSKLTVMSHQPGLWPFDPLAEAAIPEIQQALTVYILAVLVAGGLAAYVVRQREPFFVLVNLCMLFSPNIMWYHHYIFILVPLMVWMAWTRFNQTVTLWCLIGLLLIQIDRFRLTTGLLIHIYGHLCILALLAWLLWQAGLVMGLRPQTRAVTAEGG